MSIRRLTHKHARRWPLYLIGCHRPHRRRSNGSNERQRAQATGLELLLPDPEFIAQLGQNRRPDPDEADDDYYDPPPAA
jgi:hypothetical protein